MNKLKFAQDPLDISGFNLEGGDSSVEEITPDNEKIKDIPVKEENNFINDSSNDIFTESSPMENVQNIETEEQKQKNINQEIKIASLETELSTVKINFEKLQIEMKQVTDKLREIKTIFQEHLLNKIPSYEDMGIDIGSKGDNELIIRAITDSLDRKFFKLFKDMPIYQFNKFDVLQEDGNNNIINAIIGVLVSFSDVSRYKNVNFSLELIVVDGILQAPQWLFYNGNVYPLTPEGISKLDSTLNTVTNNPMIGNNDGRVTWFNAHQNNINNLSTVQMNPDIPIMRQPGSAPTWSPNKKF